MYCSGCNQEKDSEDFYLGQKQCYKCIYKLKTANCKVYKKCKHCGGSIFDRKRLSYCCDECAKAGERNSRNLAWAEDYDAAPGNF